MSVLLVCDKLSSWVFFFFLQKISLPPLVLSLLLLVAFFFIWPLTSLMASGPVSIFVCLCDSSHSSVCHSPLTLSARWRHPTHPHSTGGGKHTWPTYTVCTGWMRTHATNAQTKPGRLLQLPSNQPAASMPLFLASLSPKSQLKLDYRNCFPLYYPAK